MPVYGGSQESLQRLQRQPNMPLLPADIDAVIPYLWLLDRAIVDLYSQLADRLQSHVELRSTSAFGAATTSVAVILDAPLADAEYHVVLTPGWDTTTWVTALATDGFTINAGTAPGGAGGTVYWSIIR